MRAALVTGASTGIGYATVTELLRAGAVVYAGVRKESDAARLAALGERAHPLMLDVTDAAQIASAAQRVREGGVPLFAAICNAGVAFGGPLEFLPLERLRHQLEINLVGALAVAQSVLPMIRETKGRLLFVGSISGRIAPPFVGAYATSKAALAALTDALRFELDASHSGVSVSLFEFGNIKTPIWSKGQESIGRLEAQASTAELAHYGFLPDVMRKNLANEATRGTDAGVIGRMLAGVALGARRPRERYLAAGGAKAAALMAAILSVRARGKVLRRVMGLP